MNSLEHDLIPLMSGVAIMAVAWFILKVAGIMND